MPHSWSWTEEVGALGEVDPVVAVELWRGLRIARLWADTPAENHETLLLPLGDAVREQIGAACALAPGLIEAFGTFTALLHAPHQMDRCRLAHACDRVHQWAAAQGKHWTALHFAEAAANMDPDSPARASDAALACRRAGLEDRAGGWYLRSFKLAVRERDRSGCVQALLGYAAAMQALGQFGEARRFYDRAARRAVGTGRRREAAEAQHAVMGIAGEMGRYREAEFRARLALDLYPRNSTRLPQLAYDFASVLLRQHFYTGALSLLGHLLQALGRGEEHVLLHGTLARAAGGACSRERFEAARERVDELSDAHPESAADALLDVAEGARALREWECASLYAEKALAIARSRRDAQRAADALVLLHRIAAREPSPPEETPPQPERLEALILRFAARLRKRKAPRDPVAWCPRPSV